VACMLRLRDNSYITHSIVLDVCIPGDSKDEKYSQRNVIYLHYSI
jgi:hypothetical protein